MSSKLINLSKLLALFLLVAVPVVANIPDTQLQKVQYKLDGAWMPDLDPTEIGPSNFKTLQNMRYEDGHPVGIMGYSKINTTASSDAYLEYKSGIHFRTDRSVNYILVHAENTGETASVVMQNQTAIPNTGDFATTFLHSDDSDAGLGRFAIGPSGTVAYSNQIESIIWAGEEMRVAAAFTVDDSAGTNPIDYTSRVNNTLDDTANVVDFGTSQTFMNIFSTRPLKGIKFYVSSANSTTATAEVSFWDGEQFSACTGFVDGTSASSKTLAQTGSMTFDSTVATAKPYHFEGLYLYIYQLEISAGAADISHISLNAPFQSILDVWDGVYRQPIQFQMSFDESYDDYTLEVNEASYVDDPIGAILDGLDTTDHLIVMFEDRMAAIRFEMLAGFVNTAASTPDVSYWTGSAWTSVGTVTDGTASNSVLNVVFNQTGLMSWNPPAATLEFPKTLFGVTGYAYKITVSALLDGTHGDDDEEVLADVVTGIPAQNTVSPFKFPSSYNNRLLLCGYTGGKEGNRVDYSMTNAPDVWNGEESAMNGLQSLYFGGVEPLTCGVQLYNRFGSNVYACWAAFKNGETYLLMGNGPEDFKIYPISSNVGCPAPLTLVTAEVGFEMAEGITRNVAIFLSYSGPYMFDGAVLAPIKGIQSYFDPSEDKCINFSEIDRARGWFDPTYKEYNLVFPSGTATSCDTWLVYDLARKKWFEKDTGAAYMPQMAFQVQDTDGRKYVYAGIDTGYLMRLENDTDWDGTGITQKLATGDFFPSNNIWDQTLVRRLKVVAKKIDEDHTLQVHYYSNTSLTVGQDFIWTDSIDSEWKDSDDFEWKSSQALELDLNVGTNRLVRATVPMNKIGWAHGFLFEVTTTDSEKAFQPIAYGLEYYYVRDDL